MWKIKDEELRKAVSCFFTDEKIDEFYRQQSKDGSGYVRFHKWFSGSEDVTFELRLDRFELAYDPNGWNPYPSVTPPSEGDWFVQHKDGEFSVKEFHASYGPEGCEKWWEGPTAVCYTVVAFRALPEKYVE
jgi:hypothetical protein